MVTCDWVLAAFLVLAVFYGWRQGTVNVLGKIGAIIIAYLAARRYSTVLTVFLAEKINLNISAGNASENEALTSFLSLFIDTNHLVNGVLQTLISLVIFVIVAWLIRKIAYTITSAFGHGLLAKINRTLGAAIALFITALLILILADVVSPALSGMGLTDESSFFDSSQVIVPLIRGMENLL